MISKKKGPWPVPWSNKGCWFVNDSQYIQRLPMGLKNSLDIFQEKMSGLMEGLTLLC